MTNSARLEKSKGVVIFANNTKTIDYLSIADRASQLIKHYLNLPTTIITDTVVTTNKRYNIDSGQFEIWNNSGRSRAYELSPYDQTILIDSDYFVLDNNLLKVLDTLNDYTIVRNNNYLDGSTPDTLGKYSIPSLWATIVAFNRTSKSKMLFDLVARIEQNYSYYRKLYNIKESNYRNDFAFTIADNILNGYTQDSSNYLSWSMLSIGTPITSLELKDNKIVVKTQGNAYVLPKQSLHIMSKAYLLSDGCAQLIKDAINA
jgi:hypothetical protein